MKFEKTDVWGFEHAIRGMRNPLESWDRIDSHEEHDIEDLRTSRYVVGDKDFALMKSLIAAGSEHRKFLRQIMVSVDITAPLYWWKEFDTYKVGTVANSTSTMHKLASTPITLDCFETDDMDRLEDDCCNCIKTWRTLLEYCEHLRNKYNYTKEKKYWKELIRILPESWLQTRTVTMNYENLLTMYSQRHNHKLNEWHDFCNWIKALPYTCSLFGIV